MHKIQQSITDFTYVLFCYGLRFPRYFNVFFLGGGTLREALEMYWVATPTLPGSPDLHKWCTDFTVTNWITASRSLTEDKYWRHFMLLEHDEQYRIDINAHNNISLPLICLKINHHFRKSFHWENTNQLGPIIRLHSDPQSYSRAPPAINKSGSGICKENKELQFIRHLNNLLRSLPLRTLFNLFKPTFSETGLRRKGLALSIGSKLSGMEIRAHSPKRRFK